MAATELAAIATLLASDLLGPLALLEERWLDKAFRDVYDFEFKGSSDVHRLSVFQEVLKEAVG